MRRGHGAPGTQGVSDIERRYTFRHARQWGMKGRRSHAVLDVVRRIRPWRFHQSSITCWRAWGGDVAPSGFSDEDYSLRHRCVVANMDAGLNKCRQSPNVWRPAQEVWIVVHLVCHPSAPVVEKRNQQEALAIWETDNMATWQQVGGQWQLDLALSVLGLLRLGCSPNRLPEILACPRCVPWDSWVLKTRDSLILERDVRRTRTVLGGVPEFKHQQKRI